jgi:site-specific recombinase
MAKNDVISPDTDRYQAIEAALQRMVAEVSYDPLPLLVALFDALRPRRCRDAGCAIQTWRQFLALLEIPTYRRALHKTLITLFAERRQIAFYTESGLLPTTGFFTELWRKISHNVLPELPDEQELRDCVRIIFHGSGDHLWMDSIPVDERKEVWRLVDFGSICDNSAFQRIVDQLMVAALILSHRIAAMGLSPELSRVFPRIREEESPFLALHAEFSRLLDRYRVDYDSSATTAEDVRHLLVLLEQCRQVLTQARRATAVEGTSMALTFLLTSLNQHLTRLELLIEALSAHVHATEDDVRLDHWVDFLLDAIRGERERNSLRRHFSDLLGHIALRVTENAARTGEHYIAADRGEWWGMWRAAAGAGVLIAILALLKILGVGLHLAVLNQGLLNGLIYGIGFLIVHLLHFAIATKQPAMTAASIAATISQTRGRLSNTEQLVDLIISTSRTQVAAVAGNVVVAFPLAFGIGFLASMSGGLQLVSDQKAVSLLQEVRPLQSLAMFYAAIAGVWLFLTGLVSGYVDNMAAYGRIAVRISALPWLQRLAGTSAAGRMGDYIGTNAGGLCGNLFFGLMLGLTPAFGTMLGLPLDIRHIAFSSANIGYALATPALQVSSSVVVGAVTGVALIGLINLIVSFSLALWIAMRSRGVAIGYLRVLLPLLGRRFVASPGEFFLPLERKAATT